MEAAFERKLLHSERKYPSLAARGVELDDRSHERASRKERDGFVDEVFRDAGLPLMRVPVRSGYQCRGRSYFDPGGPVEF